MIKDGRQDVLAWLDNWINRAQGIVDQFRADLETNPHHALEWSNNVFAAVAELTLLQQVKAGLDKGVKDGNFWQVFRTQIDYVRTRVLMDSKFMNRDCSAPASCLSVEDVAAKARFVEDAEGFLRDLNAR